MLTTARTFANIPLTSATRYSSQSTQRNTIDETVTLHFKPSPKLNLLPIARAELDSQDLQALRLGFKLEAPLFSFFQLNFNVSTQYKLPETSSISEFLLSARAQTPSLLSTRLFAGVGWYKRYVLLQGVTLPALPTRSSFNEHDFAFELGLSLFEEASTFATVKAATFDSVEAFNMNNPFGEIEVGHRFNEIFLVSVFSRYQILLGFGRMDRIAFGINLNFGG